MPVHVDMWHDVDMQHDASDIKLYLLLHVHTPACSDTQQQSKLQTLSHAWQPCATMPVINPHDCVAGYCARPGLPMSPTTAPHQSHSLSGMLTNGGVSAQEHLPFVTPSRKSSSTECQLMATLHLSQQGAPFASLSKLPQTDTLSANVAPQTPLTQTNNGCVASMLKPSEPAAMILTNTATWLHWTLDGAPSLRQLCTTPIKQAWSTSRTEARRKSPNTSVSAGVRKGGTRSAAAMSTRPRVRSGCKMLQLFRRSCSAHHLQRQQIHRHLEFTLPTVYSMQMQCCLISQNLATAR